MEAERILPLIELIYDAALQPERWPVFGERICQAIASTDCNIQAFDVRSHKVHLTYTATPPAAIELYFKRYHAINPFHLRSAHLMRTGSLFCSHEVISPEEFAETEFYQEYFSQLNLFHAMVLTVLLEEDIAGNISLARSRETGVYTPEEAELLRLLLPHLQRAFRIGHLLAELKLERDLLSQTLDKLPQGAVIVNPFGQMIYLNRSAQQIFALQDGLALSREGRLRGATSDATRQLQQLISNASQNVTGLSAESGGVLQLPRPSGLRPYSLLIAPLSAELAQINYQQPAVLLFIHDPEQTVEAPEHVLQQLYGLTPAEARLAALLAQGHNVVEAAQTLGVSQNTARSHLKHIFQKTGVRRQSELVKLVLSSPAILK